MFDLLKSALSKGTRSSEFYLAILALLVPIFDGFIDKALHWINNTQTTAHSPVYVVVLAGAAAFISAAYSLARAYVKKEQVKQLPVAIALEQQRPNAVSPGPGSAEAEYQRALRAGASADQLARLSADPSDKPL